MWYNIQCWVGYVLHILLIGSILLAQGRAFFYFVVTYSNFPANAWN